MDASKLPLRTSPQSVIACKDEILIRDPAGALHGKTSQKYLGTSSNDEENALALQHDMSSNESAI